MAERNLAAMWSNYRSAGYTRLIFTNTVSVLEIPSLSAALGPGTHAFGALLTSTDATAAERLTRREIGTALTEHIERSKRAAVRLDAESTVLAVSTDERSVREIATEILGAAGWLSGNEL